MVESKQNTQMKRYVDDEEIGTQVELFSEENCGERRKVDTHTIKHKE